MLGHYSHAVSMVSTESLISCVYTQQLLLHHHTLVHFVQSLRIGITGLNGPVGQIRETINSLFYPLLCSHRLREGCGKVTNTECIPGVTHNSQSLDSTPPLMTVDRATLTRPVSWND